MEMNCLKLLKIENWIENCQKINFQLFSLSEKLKIEWKIAQNQFSFFWNFENWTKMKWTFSYTYEKGHLILVLKWNRVLILFRFSFSLSNRKMNFKSQFRFSIKIEKWTSVRFSRKSFLVRVPNVHSNFNKFLLKIELKIAKFQFLIYFSIFQFSIFNWYCLNCLVQFLINKNWKIELKIESVNKIRIIRIRIDHFDFLTILK